MNDYDLIVLGGGIVGACVAAEASSRGLRTALVEKGELGGQTSANSLRILHGGLRYLKRLDPWSARSYVNEQREWLRRDPDMFRPLRCRIPLTSRPSMKHLVYLAGLSLFNLLCFDRNRGVDPGSRLPPAGLDRAGAYWYDAQILHPRELVVRYAEAGRATVLTGLEAVELNRSAGRVAGVVCREVESGRERELKSDLVIVALGPWTNALLKRSSLTPLKISWMQGINVLLDFPFSDDAIALWSRGRRMYFLTPLPGQTLAGTGQYPLQGEPEDWSPGHLPPEPFLRELAELHPNLIDCAERLAGLFRGLIPTDHPGSIEPLQEDLLNDRSDKGLVCLIGAKYSSARRLAYRAVDLLGGS